MLEIVLEAPSLVEFENFGHRFERKVSGMRLSMLWDEKIVQTWHHFTWKGEKRIVIAPGFEPGTSCGPSVRQM